MSLTEELEQVTAESGTAPIEISIVATAMAVWRRRRWLAKVVGAGTLAAICTALLIPNKYTSTAQLMPPDSQALSSTSMLSALAGGGAMAPSLAGGLMSARTPGGTFIGILSSQTAENDIINRYDLRRVYRCKLYLDARKILAERTSIVEDKKSGIISISVMDRDPNRARDLAQAYVEELDKLVNRGSTSSARRERVFLEERLQAVKSDLDASSLALSQFSSRNATLDPQKQGEATVEAAGKLEGELIGVESELSGLEAMYTDDNVRVKQARARAGELQSQLRKMQGVGEAAGGDELKAGQFMPSIRELPLLGVKYSDLYRQVVMQESIYQTLTKQYELAKVQEAKEIPPVRVLDEPDVPERKSTPHRLTIVLFGLSVSVFAGIGWIIAAELWKQIRAARAARAV